MSTFHHKVAVVTGAGSGIGRALALGLAARGARLALSDIDEAGLGETAELAARAGATVHHQRLDVSDRDAFEAYASTVAAHFGVVHQIYNNAGVARSGPVLEFSYNDYERVLNINLWGVIHGTKAFLPHLIASGDGHVVNVSSLNGLMAYPGSSAYCTSKFAVRGFTEALRIEMLQDRLPVGVTVVHPGGVKTNITNNAMASAREAGVELSAADVKRARDYEQRFLRLSPDAAAKTILDGVAAGKPRVLVGNDAKAIDKLVRLLPRLYPRIVARVTPSRAAR
ncbi:SDR family NAD(P)-dependent oxidoreductase [Conexibacter woesei]|uniref:SDR family NAD(P)-dependent oxidoreductase n=1 Tax=Conexibacter woesei TaxID=191495 RepID=UPI0004045852